LKEVKKEVKDIHHLSAWGTGATAFSPLAAFGILNVC
jgi:hypothetical protein